MIDMPAKALGKRRRAKDPNSTVPKLLAPKLALASRRALALRSLPKDLGVRNKEARSHSSRLASGEKEGMGGEKINPKRRAGQDVGERVRGSFKSTGSLQPIRSFRND